MNYKEFFWATKQKTILAIALFVLANILFLPVIEKTDCMLRCAATTQRCQCPTYHVFVNVLDLFSGKVSSPSVDLPFEVVYLGFSFLASCFVFHALKKKGGK